MIVESVIAEYFATNCWILAPSRNSECIIVDPGITIPSILARLKEVIGKYNLKPVAVVLTHGHFDHTFSVLPVADGYDIPVMIHSKDRGLLTHPMKALAPGGPSEQLIKQFGNGTFAEPKTVINFEDSQNIVLAGLPIKVQHAPGHTAGSTIFVVNSEILISGDVLFEGSIGRTDLPTGSAPEMRKTLKNLILPLDDELIVLPGHGAQTTIGRERRKNEYLTDQFLDRQE